MKFGFAASRFGPLLLLAACSLFQSSPPPPATTVEAEVEQPPESGEIKVALLLPLSGPAADLGQDMLDAAQMALFDVGENNLVLMPRDTGGTPEGAAQAAKSLIDEGAEVIIGPLFNRAVSAVTPIAQLADVRVLAFSNVATVAADGTFLLGFRPEEQVKRVVRFTLDQGLIRIAGLAPRDAYGRTAMEELRRTVIEGGGELSTTVFYPPELADPSAIVREVAAYDERQEALEEERALLEERDDEASQRALKRLETLDTLGEPPFDAIMIADGGDRLRSVAALLTFYDVDPVEVRFLGTTRWQDDPRVLNEGALQSAWYAAPSPDISASFSRRFETVIGRRPQHLAALAYDATALAVIVARDLRDRQFKSATLTNAEGFEGATGLFRLRPDGLADHGLAILEVKGDDTRAIDPPPDRFVDELAVR